MTLAIALLALSFSREVKAQVDFKVDSTMNWIGYINVFNLPAPDGDGAYQTGFVSPTGNLPAVFGGEQTVLGPSELVLGPNTSTYTENADDPFWVDQDTGLGNKQIAAVMYVEPGDIVLGKMVTFSGTVISDTLTSDYTVTAFIKVLNPASGYSEVTRTDVPITDATTSFNAELDLTSVTDTSLLPQFGFEVIGRNVSEQDAETTGTVVVAVENPDPLFTTQPEAQTVTAGTTVEFSAEAVGTSDVSFQWQKDGDDLADGGDISGATTADLSIANSEVSDSGEYTVVATDEAGSTTSNIAQLTVLNLQILQAPADQRVPVGSTVVFSVEATSPFDVTYQWSSVVGGFISPLTDGGDVSGATTGTLTLTNVQLGDSGAYQVTISAGSDSTDLSATLLVKTQEDYLNFLENPNFENDPAGIDESPWMRFPGSDPALGSFQDSNDTYYNGGNVNVFEGNYVSYTVFNADFSGIYQDVIAHAGQVFTADIHFYNASGDPIPEGTTAYLEVQFRNAEDAVIRQYVSATLDSTTTRDTWMDFPANLAGDFGFDPPTEDADELIAPFGTTSVRFQVTLVGGTGDGSLYYDAATLMLVDEVEVQEPGNLVPVADIPSTPGTGLDGRYWKRPTASVTALAGDGLEIMDSEPPNATFTATTLSYTGNDLTLLTSWLGTDGASVVFSDEPDPANLDDALFSFTGLIAIPEAGEVTLGTPSDDGTIVWISNERVINNDGSHGAPGDNPEGSTTFSAAGLFPIEIAYFNADWTDGSGNHGGAQIDFQVNGAAVDPATLYPMSILDSGGAMIESITLVDNTVEIRWTDPAAVLQESVTGVDGEYVDVPDATSPYPVDTTGKDSRFYRLKK